MGNSQTAQADNANHLYQDYPYANKFLKKGVLRNDWTFTTEEFEVVISTIVDSNTILISHESKYGSKLEILYLREGTMSIYTYLIGHNRWCVIINFNNTEFIFKVVDEKQNVKYAIVIDHRDILKIYSVGRIYSKSLQSQQSYIYNSTPIKIKDFNGKEYFIERHKFNDLCKIYKLRNVNITSNLLNTVQSLFNEFVFSAIGVVPSHISETINLCSKKILTPAVVRDREFSSSLYVKEYIKFYNRLSKQVLITSSLLEPENALKNLYSNIPIAQLGIYDYQIDKLIKQLNSRHFNISIYTFDGTPLKFIIQNIKDAANTTILYRQNSDGVETYSYKIPNNRSCVIIRRGPTYIFKVVDVNFNWLYGVVINDYMLSIYIGDKEIFSRDLRTKMQTAHRINNYVVSDIEFNSILSTKIDGKMFSLIAAITNLIKDLSDPTLTFIPDNGLISMTTVDFCFNVKPTLQLIVERTFEETPYVKSYFRRLDGVEVEPEPLYVDYNFANSLNPTLDESTLDKSIKDESTLDKSIKDESTLDKSIKDESKDVSHLDENICIICMDKPREIVFVDCGHLITCKVCSRELNKCPMCRVAISKKIVVYK
jgi:hypothetical protein